ncbi:hypothetical protein HK102_000540 [Quaeritorhiza haematococci]|nr:hypothetical protein HK102_000540 [Quaeritorhiza haematococci]
MAVLSEQMARLREFHYEAREKLDQLSNDISVLVEAIKISSTTVGTAEVTANDLSGSNDSEFSEESIRSRRIYHEDFESVFGIRATHKVEEDPAITAILDAHDIRNDETYLTNPTDSERLAATLGPYIDQGFENDRRFFVRWVDAAKGYGLFAQVPVTKNQVVGIYTGQLFNSSISDYQWAYQSNGLKDPNGNTMDLGVDGRYAGNWLRFVNHNEDPNTDPVFVPYKNRWWILYVTNRLVRAGEEVTVSYGSAYWETRENVQRVQE